MNAITKKECEIVFLKYVYTAISNSGQFDTACLKWKALPDADRSKNKQCRAYFERKYKQATRSGFITIQDKQDKQNAVNTRQEAINASVLQMVAARSTTGGDGIDDNATAFSALTASSAVKDRRIIGLELQL
jgi:hypothetical protein